MASRGAQKFVPWDMEEITAGLRKTQWRRKVRASGEGGEPAGAGVRRGRGWAGIQDPAARSSRYPPVAGRTQPGTDSERGKDGEVGLRRGAPDEGQGTRACGKAARRSFRTPPPSPALPGARRGAERGYRKPCPAPRPRARVRSGPRTSHPVPGRHPTQGPGVGWGRPGPALPPPRGPGLPGAARAAGGSRAHGREVAASASALRLVKTRWTPSRQHPSQKDGWFPARPGRPRGPHSALYFPRPCATAREQGRREATRPGPRPRGRRGVCPDTELAGPGSPMAFYLRLWPEGQARG